MDFSPLVNQATTFRAAVQVGRSLEYIVEGKILTKEEVGKRNMGKEISKPNKKGRYPKYNTNNKKHVDNNEAIWCQKCRKKHIGQCTETVACYKCVITGHYAN